MPNLTLTFAFETLNIEHYQISKIASKTCVKHIILQYDEKVQTAGCQ